MMETTPIRANKTQTNVSKSISRLKVLSELKRIRNFQAVKFA